MCVHGHRRYLPDLPILSIFEALPLYKLLKTGRVCPRFAQLQAEALANRKMLTIFVGDNVDRKWTLYESELFFEPHLDTHTTRQAEVEMAEYSALEMPNLNQEMVNWLKSTFPRVTKLRLILEKDNEFADVMIYVIQLLEHWAEKLESFGIWAEYPVKPEERLIPLESLFPLVNAKLPSLQSLTIATNCYGEGSYNVDLSFLARLKLFSTNIDSFDGDTKPLLESLNHYGALLENLPEIRLFGYSDIDLVQAMPPRLASKVTALYADHMVHLTENGPEKDFAMQFPALKWYKQNGFEYGINLCSFFTSLSKLSHLAYLELWSVPFCYPERFHFHQEVPPLASLEALTIYGNIQDQHFLQLFAPLDRLFPALKTIFLDVELNYNVIERQPTDYRSASKPHLEETFGGILRQLVQLRLKGTLDVGLLYRVSQEGDNSVAQKHIYNYYYKETFNFTDGRPMEDWHFNEEKIVEFFPDSEAEDEDGDE